MTRFFVSILGVGVTLFFSMASLLPRNEWTQNAAPQVTITTPGRNSGFGWDSVIPYSIRVSDREDGESAYEEINGQEVLLSVAYLSDSTRLPSHWLQQSALDIRPLVAMARTTCLSCHKVKDKLIGPSFENIANRYRGRPASLDTLVEKVRGGASGNWGDVQMPPHPELDAQTIRTMVRWILAFDERASEIHFWGIQGSFHTRTRPAIATGKEVYVLTARYYDHGVDGNGQGSRMGEHRVVLRNY
jgi:cytochrome c